MKRSATFREHPLPLRFTNFYSGILELLGVDTINTQQRQIDQPHRLNNMNKISINLLLMKKLIFCKLIREYLARNTFSTQKQLPAIRLLSTTLSNKFLESH